MSDELARNALVRLGAAPYLLVVNADDEVFADTLAELVGTWTLTVAPRLLTRWPCSGRR